MTEPIHPRMQLLIDAMPLPDQISVRHAATILRRTEMEVLDLVADGQIMSWTHSPLDGEQLRHINHITKEEKWLPRIAADTDPWTVWLDVEDVAWLCCLQFERPLHATDDPPKEAIERRLQYARDMAKMQPPPEPAAQPEAVLMPSPAAPAVAESWHIKEPERFHGYILELYRVLKAAHDAGKPRPTARDVLDSWTASKPPNILEVMTDEFKYLDSSGSTKTVGLKALRKAIDRMASARQEADRPDKNPISPTRGR